MLSYLTDACDLSSTKGTICNILGKRVNQEGGNNYMRESRLVEDLPISFILITTL